MRRIATLSILALTLLPGAVLAATNCDSQPKPALDCPTGYSMMCIPTGGDHWGCGKEGAGGGIEEVPPAQTRPVESVVVSEPAATASDTAQQSAQPTQAQVAPSAPPMPNVPAPLIAQAAADPSPTGTEAPPEAFQVEIAAPDAEEILEIAEERAPTALKPIVAAVAGTLAVVTAFLGIWEWFRKMKEKKTGKCDRCGETTGEKCAKCDGSGKIEQEHEVTVKCTHCKGSGVDPCHHCGGTGKMSLPNPPQSEAELEGWPPCDFCGGSGVKKVGAGRDWGEANDAVKNGQFACCFCKGKKEETVKLKRQVDCPDCKGTGKK
jgi:hypothetical protein